MKRVRILLADDHAVVVEGLCRILNRPEFQVVGTVCNGQDLVNAALKLQPDVILADVSMPGMSGIEAVRKLAAEKCPAKIIFLTMHPEVSYATEALRSGGSGYVLKTSAGGELVDAIGEVIRGKTFIATAIRSKVQLALQSGPRKSRTSTDRLTPRQRQVLQLLAEGRQVKEIAAHLGISPKTVEFHKQQMKETLGAHTVAELARYAERHGIVA